MSITSTDVPRGAARLLTRVLVVPLLVLVVVTALVVAAKALAVREAGTALAETSRPVAEQPWKDAYSRRFPGCVPAVLWPAQRTPAQVVVQWDDRTVERVARGGPLRRALAANGPEAAEIIGACYR